MVTDALLESDMKPRSPVKSLANEMDSSKFDNSLMRAKEALYDEDEP